MKTIDILLAFPIPSFESPNIMTPLSILFPGALFEKQGKKVACFDERFDSQEMLVDLIKHSKEIGVSAFTGYQSKHAAMILEKAKKINPKIVTGVGGVHARILSEQVLAEPFVDKVWTKRVYGEDLFPYNKRTRIHFERCDMQYFTSRGCPFNCSFCTLCSPWEPKDIKEIDRELKIIHNDIGFKTVNFSDPNIACGSATINRIERVTQLGTIMKDLDVNWISNMRASYFTPKMVDVLVESKCKAIEIGCESGSDYFLKNVIRKGYGVDIIKRAAKNIRDSGISIMYSFMTNMPRETKKMQMETFDLVDWIVETDSNARVSIYNYAPYPGTKMYEDAVNGIDEYPKFNPPTTMEEWANLVGMKSPLYWIVGLCFRKDNTRKNFPGNDWKLIESYIELAEKKWKERDIKDFPCKEVEELINKQFKKREKINAKENSSLYNDL